MTIKHQFNLTIELGNAAMQHPLDVADALRDVAIQLELARFGGDEGVIMDMNGNTVGKWTADYPAEEPASDYYDDLDYRDWLTEGA